MLIYNYHPDSGEFMGTSEADPNPVETGEFIIPAHATTIEPPGDPSAGHAMAWDGSDWVEIEDHRGEVWWNDAGEPMTVNMIGRPVDHGLVSEPPPQPEPPLVAKIRFALVHDGTVLQTLEADCPMQWQLLDGCRMVVDADAKARPGYLYDGTTFAPPPAPAEPANDAA